MEGEDGLSGVGAVGNFCGRDRYQVKIMCPNLEGFELAPATAICDEDMKRRAADCIAVGCLGGMVFVDGVCVYFAE